MSCAKRIYLMDSAQLRSLPEYCKLPMFLGKSKMSRAQLVQTIYQYNPELQKADEATMNSCNTCPIPNPCVGGVCAIPQASRYKKRKRRKTNKTSWGPTKRKSPKSRLYGGYKYGYTKEGYGISYDPRYYTPAYTACNTGKCPWKMPARRMVCDGNVCRYV